MGMKWVYLLIDEKGADKLLEALDLSSKEHRKIESAQGRLEAHLTQVKYATKAISSINWKNISATQLTIPWTKGGKLISQLDKDLRLSLGVKEVS